MAEDELEDENLDEEEEEEDGEDSGEASSGGKKKLLIIVGAVLLLLIGGGAAAYFTGLLDPLMGASEAASEEAIAGEDGAAVFLDLDEMIVNINTSGRRQTILKMFKVNAVRYV